MRESAIQVQGALASLAGLSCAVCATLCAPLGARAAHLDDLTGANVTDVSFGFEISSVSADPLFSFSNVNSSNSSGAMLHTNPGAMMNPPTVNLGVTDETDPMNPITAFFINAAFDLSATVDNMQIGTFGALDIYELLLNGSFLFTDSGSMLNIVSVDFTGARLLLLADHGDVVFKSGVGASDNVTFTPGPALIGAGIDFTDSPMSDSEFNFSIVDVSSALHVMLDAADPNAFLLNDFSFNSSFAGHVPEPSTLALSAIALMTLLPSARRRR